MKTAKQQAYLFFLRNAGFSYDPKTQTKQAGRAACAHKLAKAERDARALGYTFEWSHDLDGCIGCDCGSDDCACATGEHHECLSVLMYDPEHKHVVDSLDSICEPTWDYRRVIEAELASKVTA
jgi:hypothetical protein